MLEVCIDSLESALNAVHGGANELEICSSLAEGGLTPSAGLVEEIAIAVQNIACTKPLHRSCPPECHCLLLTQKPKLNVMLRCRAGSDFCYSQAEMDTMLSDLRILKTSRIDRFVFGALTEDRAIDIESCTNIVSSAAPLPVTFHRAFDVTKDPFQSFDTIASLGFNRLLTSGQGETAANVDAVNIIKALVEKSKGRVQVMPGAGVNANNVRLFIKLGCEIVHSSCKVRKELPNFTGVSMGSNDSECVFVCGEDVVRDLKCKITIDS